MAGVGEPHTPNSRRQPCALRGHHDHYSGPSAINCVDVNQSITPGHLSTMEGAQLVIVSWAGLENPIAGFHIADDNGFRPDIREARCPAHRIDTR